MKIKLLAILVIGAIIGTAGMFTNSLPPLEAAGAICPNVAAISGADSQAVSRTYGPRIKMTVVYVKWDNVSYAASYRVEATPTRGGSTKSTTQSGWMGRGKQGVVIYRVSAKDHDVRILALNRAGSIVACATDTARHVRG